MRPTEENAIYILHNIHNLTSTDDKPTYMYSYLHIYSHPVGTDALFFSLFLFCLALVLSVQLTVCFGQKKKNVWLCVCVCVHQLTQNQCSFMWVYMHQLLQSVRVCVHTHDIIIRVCCLFNVIVAVAATQRLL